MTARIILNTTGTVPQGARVASDRLAPSTRVVLLSSGRLLPSLGEACEEIVRRARDQGAKP